jgi:hypothetical protein
MWPEMLAKDDLYKRLLATVTVAADNMIGDQIDGHIDEQVYLPSEEQQTVQALSSSERELVLSPELLSQRWGIELETAK